MLKWGVKSLYRNMEKNKVIDRIKEEYKPYRITKKNSIYILNSSKGDIVVKDEVKIDYNKLYSYLYSRSFSYVPKIIDSYDRMVIFQYEDDLSINREQKAQDLIRLVALLHSKTAYFKDVTNDLYKEIYENLRNNIYYVSNLYDRYYKEFIEVRYYSPCMYLYLRNYSLIYNAINYCKDKLDEWFNSIKEKNRERVVLVHNNLRLEHMIKNTGDYLISWDNYDFDTPVLDLFHLYQNEWENMQFKEVLNSYNREFNLLDDEKLLLDLLISIPYAVELDGSEYENTCKIRKLINYLNSGSHIVLDN